ncbi:MAG: hypothetical protein BRD30_04610, partial [Bacteroidetes bacterium QH_2_63_10]
MSQQDATSSRNGASADGSSSSDSPLLRGDPETPGGTGEGIDREIETSFFTPKRIALAVVVV